MDAKSETAAINKEVWSAVDSVRQKEASHSERIRFLEEKVKGLDEQLENLKLRVELGR